MEIVQAQEPVSSGVGTVALGEKRPQLDDLVFRAQGGDLSAYEAIYERHVGRVHALCLRMTANADRAEELTQDAFVRAWEKLRSFRGESEFSAWLGRVAVNVVLAERRSRGRRPPETPMGDAPELRHPAADLRPESGFDLEQAIGRLPARARAVFVLHDVEGYRHAEIAGLLDISAGTSKAQLHRARKLLREALR